MARYASKTQVSPGRSREEIERILIRYGATGFVFGWDEESGKAIVAFKMANRKVRFELPLPPRDEFVTTPTGRDRAEGPAIEAWEQACRQRWRALVLTIKAKLESVESEIEVFDEAFLAQIMLPDGKTVGHSLLPQVESAYEEGTMPPLLMAPKKGTK